MDESGQKYPDICFHIEHLINACNAGTTSWILSWNQDRFQNTSLIYWQKAWKNLERATGDWYERNTYRIELKENSPMLGDSKKRADGKGKTMRKNDTAGRLKKINWF